MSIEMATAVVSGGASGLGYAVAKTVIAKGGQVALLDVDRESGEQAARTLGERALFTYCDVTSEESINQAVSDTLEQFGQISLTVNCAGIVTGQRVVGRDELMPADDFKRLIDINLTGTFLVCRAAANVMQFNAPQGKDNERGVIVNTASIAAFDGQIGQVSYAASKGGVASMTLPLAREFAAFGVRVVTVAPGVFATPMFDRYAESTRHDLVADTPHPLRAGDPDEFAALVVHIYENPMLNGEVIRLDGALRLPPKSR
ncbi:MAG: SDR family NAD(P)-dependent oxidoreductase [Candidatus Thiodiazotropha sp. (ex Monitilora ramsayi)]|nr:SDR family NAD(P)-dependent oxidoreductase [Candidatus Thiodiazotropha sp. (ex Monitilora ramsayi)]